MHSDTVAKIGMTYNSGLGVIARHATKNRKPKTEKHHPKYGCQKEKRKTKNRKVHAKLERGTKKKKQGKNILKTAKKTLKKRTRLPPPHSR